MSRRDSIAKEYTSPMTGPEGAPLTKAEQASRRHFEAKAYEAKADERKAARRAAYEERQRQLNASRGARG